MSPFELFVKSQPMTSLVIQLTSQILASDIGATGESRVEVSSPAPCGGDSNLQPFRIEPSTDSVLGQSRLLDSPPR